MFVTKLKIAAVMLLVIGVAAGGVWTQARTAAPQAEAKAEAPPPKPAGGDKKKAEPIRVKVVKPKPGGLKLKVIQRADVVAAQQQQVVPFISGTIKEVRVAIGDRVKKGQTLIVFDAPLLGKEVEQAMAALEMAKAQLEEAEAQMVMAKAEVESAQASLSKEKAELSAAETRLKVAEELAGVLQKKFESGTLPMQAFGEAKEKVAAARAKVQLAGPAITTAEADVQVKMGKLALARAARKRASANVSASKATVDRARIQESFTELKAAFDGYVTRRTIDAGNFVQPSDSRLLSPLLTVQSFDPLRLVVQLPAEYALRISLGDPGELVLSDLNSRIGGLKVTRFNSALDPEKRTMRVEMDVPNPDGRLMPGMVGQVTIHFKKVPAGTMVVPSSCLLTGQSIVSDTVVLGADVYVVRDGKAYLTPVTLGHIGEGEAEIVQGIKESDLIVTEPPGKPGEVVREVVPVKVEKEP